MSEYSGFISNQRHPVFDKCACYRRIITNFKFLLKHDRYCEGISGTGYRWAYDSSTLAEKLGWQATPFFSCFKGNFGRTLENTFRQKFIGKLCFYTPKKGKITSNKRYYINGAFNFYNLWFAK